MFYAVEKTTSSMAITLFNGCRLLVALLLISPLVQAGLADDISEMNLEFKRYLGSTDHIALYGVPNVIHSNTADLSGSLATLRLLYADSTDLRRTYYKEIIARLIERRDADEDAATASVLTEILSWSEPRSDSAAFVSNWAREVFDGSKLGKKFFQTLFYERSGVEWQKTNYRWVDTRLTKYSKKIAVINWAVYVGHAGQSAYWAALQIQAISELNVGISLAKLDALEAQVLSNKTSEFRLDRDPAFTGAILDLRATLTARADEGLLSLIQLLSDDGSIADWINDSAHFLFVSPATSLLLSKYGVLAKIPGGTFIIWATIQLASEVLTDIKGQKFVIGHMIIGTLLWEGFGIKPTSGTSVARGLSEVSVTAPQILSAKLRVSLLQMFYDSIVDALHDPTWIVRTENTLHTLVLREEQPIDAKFVKSKSISISASLVREYGSIRPDAPYASLIWPQERCPMDLKAGKAIAFRVESNLGASASYEWLFTGGNVGEISYSSTAQPEISYRFGSAGSYRVSVLAIAPTGELARSSLEISIGDAGLTTTGLQLVPSHLALSVKRGAQALLPDVAFAVVEYSDGSSTLAIADCHPMTWSIREPNIASVASLVGSANPTGGIVRLSGLKEGKATLTGALGNLRASASIEVGSVFPDVASDTWYSDAVHRLYRNSVIEGKDGGWFKPEAPVTRAEFIKMLVKAGGFSCWFSACASGDARYTDVNERDWYFLVVQIAFKKGWLSGGAGSDPFRPNENITRAEAAKLLIQALDTLGRRWSTGWFVQFEDVRDSSAWFYDAVLRARNEGLMQGYAGGTGRYFRPERAINRAEAAVVVDRAFSND